MVKYKLINGILRSARKRSAGGDIMSIHTGLSRTVAGRLIWIERDNMTRIARVLVRKLDGRDITSVEEDAVATSAQLLAGQACRALGMRWTVQEWDGVTLEQLTPAG